jgi:hypothetical protein
MRTPHTIPPAPRPAGRQHRIHRALKKPSFLNTLLPRYPSLGKGEYLLFNKTGSLPLHHLFEGPGPGLLEGGAPGREVQRRALDWIRTLREPEHAVCLWRVVAVAGFCPGSLHVGGSAQTEFLHINIIGIGSLPVGAAFARFFAILVPGWG